jgi:DNA invertase Pin-like site-specific DNA recombinase
MVYGYIRVSTERQSVENQRYEIRNYAKERSVAVDRWIEETISGAADLERRKLSGLLKRVKSGDLIICSELSRLGRNLLQIMAILNTLMRVGAKVWTIKDGYKLGDDIPSKVLAFAFGLAAEIERDLISQRTKEALARRRAEGVILGRPRGRKSRAVKLSGREGKIKSLLARGLSLCDAAKLLRVHRVTLSAFIKERL